MTVLLNMLGLLSSLILSAFSSGTETGLYRVSRVRMRLLQDKGDKKAGLLLFLLDKMDTMVTTILVSNNIANYAGTYFLTVQLLHWGVPRSDVVATLILTPVFFVFGESLPKQIAYNHANGIAHACAGAINTVRLVLSPAVWLLNRTSAGLRNLFGIKGDIEMAPSRRARLMEYFDAGVAEKIITEDQNKMARQIMALESMNAAAFMIPAARALLLPERASRARAMENMAGTEADLIMLTSGSGRLTGRMITRNILIRNPGRPEEPLAGLAMELGRIKSGASLPEVLLWLKREHAQRVAVTERGRIIGVITTKSILDCIARL